MTTRTFARYEYFRRCRIEWGAFRVLRIAAQFSRKLETARTWQKVQGRQECKDRELLALAQNQSSTDVRLIE